MITEQVNQYLANLKQWQQELTELRQIALESGLEETFKWNQPCYTWKGKNVIFLNSFKNYCSLGFFKGALLRDKAQLLTTPGDNSRSMRQWRFTKLQEITDHESTMQAYIKEAIEIENAGLTIPKKTIKETDYPSELIEYIHQNKDFKTAFESLTPGRKRAYVIYFSEAKQSTTRLQRIWRYSGRILQGKGINDCICGLSKRYPSCDGSHNKVKN